MGKGGGGGGGGVPDHPEYSAIIYVWFVEGRVHNHPEDLANKNMFLKEKVNNHL